MHRIKVKGRSQTALLVRFDNTGAGIVEACRRWHAQLLESFYAAIAIGSRAVSTAVNGTSPNYFST